MTDSTNISDAARRVVVTGMGAISPAGAGVDALWQAVCEGTCCLGELTRFDKDIVDMHIVGEVKDFDPQDHGLDAKQVRRYDPFLQYAVVAAKEAFQDSGLDMDKEDANRAAVIFGSGIGGLATLEREHSNLLNKGARRVSPLFIPMMISNIAAGTIAIDYGFKGECYDITTACATGTHAIGEAFRSIRHGYSDIAIAGGSEGCITPMCIAGFTNLSALSHGETPQTASLPFDKRRSGFVPAEGAGALVLESLEHALARGAKILGEIVGYGSTCDAYHITAPDPTGDGSYRAMAEALKQGGYTPEDVDHINAHGTGTAMNDKTEASAIRTLLGDHTDEVYVTSIKGSVGHMLGGAGAVEAIVTLKTVAENIIPPTVGFAQADPECPVLVPTTKVCDKTVGLALSNSLGFGGHNSALAFVAYEEA